MLWYEKIKIDIGLHIHNSILRYNYEYEIMFTYQNVDFRQ